MTTPVMFRFLAILLLLALVPLSGCRQTAGSGPFGRTASGGGFPFGGAAQSQQVQAQTPEQYEQFSQLANQINSLNQRLGSFDSDNQQLLTEVASLKQKLQVAND